MLELFGINSDVLSDEFWIISFKVGLVVLEMFEFTIPMFFWIYTPIGIALNWIFHLAVGAIAYDFSAGK